MRNYVLDDRSLLDAYKNMLKMPVVADPDYFHQSRSALAYGHILKPSAVTRTDWLFSHSKMIEFEEIFEDVRKRHYPKRPSRLSSVFLWPTHGQKIEPYKFPKPVKRNLKKIRERTGKVVDGLEVGGFGYVVDIAPGANIFYGSNGLIGHIIDAIKFGDYSNYIGRDGAAQLAVEYWSYDLRGKQRSARSFFFGNTPEVLVDGIVKVIGLPPYEIV